MTPDLSKSQIAHEINSILMECDTPNSIPITLSADESIIKKCTDKLSRALDTVYEKHKKDMQYHELIVMLSDYQDPEFLYGEVLSERSKKIVADEMKKKYNIDLRKLRKKKQ